MDINDFFNENERPLERLIDGAGFCDILHTVGCVGDSLSSGEFETKDSEGKSHYDDNYSYSWGQAMARATGNTYYNFSKGGMSAKSFVEGYGDQNGFFDKQCDAYIIALGVNDCWHDILTDKKYDLGSIDDVNFENPDLNKKNFIGSYAKIIQRYKKTNPYARFFLVTMPKKGDDSEYSRLQDGHAELLYKLAEKFDRTYVVDLRKYGPLYDDAFRSKFFLNSHMNAAGYVLTAKMMLSYIDYIIRHNLDDFRLIGTVKER